MNIYTETSTPTGTLRQALTALAGDRVIQTILVIMGLLVLMDPPQLTVSLLFTASALWEMLPFFLLAIAIAAFAKATSADALIAKSFHGDPTRTIILAALIGALSPFCSCGVIPLIAGMLGAGVPLAPVMAFWIASPIMDPEMFVLTAAGIGLDFAVAKTIAAMGMGLLAGFIVSGIQRVSGMGSPLRSAVVSGCVKPCTDAKPHVLWTFWQESWRIDAFYQEVISIGRFLGKWLTLAFFLESLMIAYVSSDWIVAYVGADNPFAIPLAAVIGAPSYLNGYAAIPLISGLLDIGMTPGAAMAFSTAGAVSSIPAAIAVWALVRRPVFALYLLLGLCGAMLSGWIYQFSVGML